MLTRIGAVIICILTAVWLARSPDWEPLIAFLTAFGSYVGIEFYQRPKEKKHEDDAHEEVRTPAPDTTPPKGEPAPPVLQPATLEVLRFANLSSIDGVLIHLLADRRGGIWIMSAGTYSDSLISSM